MKNHDTDAAWTYHNGTKHSYESIRRNPHYLDWAIRLSRPGTVIILDNVVRDGRVVEAKSQDRNVKGARAAFELLKTHPRVDSTALQTVGLKGWDGFILGVVKGT